jgi:hypothetical protein
MAKATTIDALEHVHGRYNELGYQVFAEGKQVYFALNHIHDTHAFADPDGDEAVPVGTLKEFCMKVCEQEAEDRGLKVGGVAYVDWRGE